MNDIAPAGEPLRQGFRVGEWLVRPTQDIVSKNGLTVHLRPKVMDVLYCLAQRPGEVVPNEVILETVWGKRFLARSSLSGAICELRDVLGDDRQNPTMIETVAKRGYRLVAPVGVIDAPAAAAAPVVAPVKKRWLMIGATALVALTAAGVFLLVRGGRVVGDGGVPSLVVLPFTNLGSASDEFFGAAITDEITARLAAVRGLKVISHDSAVSYTRDQKSKGLSEIGRELGVGHVLQGTVNWDAVPGTVRHVRITTRLVRVNDGAVLWADVFDRSTGDVLAVQSEIGRRVADELGVNLLGREREALDAVTTKNPEAYQAYLRARHYHANADEFEQLTMAIRMYERAIELDPEFALAYASVAHAHAQAFHFGFDRTPARRKLAGDAIAQAQRLAPDLPEVHLWRAYVEFFVESNNEDALREVATAERAMPRRAEALALRGFILRRLGRVDEALVKLRDAVELNPREAGLFRELGTTRALLKRYGEADADFARSIALSPDQHGVYALKAFNRLLWTRSVAAARAELAKEPAPDRAESAVERCTVEIYARDYGAALAALELVPEAGVAGQWRYTTRSLLAGEVFRLEGKHERALAAFEVARGQLERAVAARPDDWRLHESLALAWAGLGRRNDAVREATRSLDICSRSGNVLASGFALVTLARVHVMTGDLDGATAVLELLAVRPTHVQATPLLELDPTWDPLRDRPRFAKLLPAVKT